MFDINLFIGVMVGLLIGAIGMWVLDRRHQRILKKLVESRRKIERQRTQAVNDLFALRAEMEDPKFRAQHQSMDVVASAGPDPKTAAELANLRSLIARADGALTSARRKRDEHEREIARLRTVLEERHEAADVIDLSRPKSAGGLAL